MLSSDIRTVLGDLVITLFINVNSKYVQKEKNIHVNRASKMSYSIEAVAGPIADGQCNFSRALIAFRSIVNKSTD